MMSKFNKQQVTVAEGKKVCSCGEHNGIGKATPHERAQMYNWHRFFNKCYEEHMRNYLNSYEAAHGHLPMKSFLHNDSRFAGE